MQRILFLALFASSVFIHNTQPARADEDKEDIPTVYVSATRSETSSVSTPALISIINRDDIDASGAGNLVEVLESQAGIQMQDLFGDGSRAKISMRGFGADNAAANVLVMVDGRRLNHTDLSAPDLGSIALGDVERIEIIQGSAGALFGDQAVAGVVNIITRKTDKPTTEAGVALGSYNARAYRATVGTRTANGASIRASAEAHTTDNYRDYNWQDYKNGSVTTSIPITRGSLGFGYQAINEYLQLPGALSAAQVAADRRQAATASDFNDGSTNIARGTLRRSLSDNWNLEAELTNRKGDVSGALYGAAFDQHRQHWGLTPRLVGSIPGSAGDTVLTLGADINQTDYRFQLPSYSIDTVAAQSMNAVYAQGIIPLHNKMKLTVGARHVQAIDDITDASAFPSGVRLDKSATVAELGLARELGNRWRLFARRDGNLRFAKVDENTFTRPTVTSLEPQTGASYELGAQWKNDRKRFNAVVYQLDLDNEIDYDGTADGPYGPGTGANVNLDPTRRLGLSMDGRLPLSSRLTLDLQYAYIDAVFRGGSYSGNEIPFVARHNFTASTNWRLARAWRLFVESRYTGDRYQGGDYDNLLAKLPAMTIVNTGISYSRGPWLVDFRINNVGDVEYSGYATYNTYYPAPKRNFTFKARYQLH